MYNVHVPVWIAIPAVWGERGRGGGGGLGHWAGCGGLGRLLPDPYYWKPPHWEARRSVPAL